MKRLLIVVVCMNIGNVMSGTRTLDINRELLLLSYIIRHELAAIQNNPRRLEAAVQPAQLRPQVIPVQQQENTPKKLFSKKRRCHEIKNNRGNSAKHVQNNKRIQQPRERGRK
ncbi:MAG TPA: hypothetical protein VKU36_05230 [Candidatus Babeliales bacterium]|nr:hypothetical protein [Candidatus Babeliales bacterium]